MRYFVILTWLVAGVVLVAGVSCSSSTKVSEAEVLRATGQAEDADRGYDLQGDQKIEDLLQQQAQREDKKAAQKNRISRLESSYGDTGATLGTPAEDPSVEEGIAAGGTSNSTE